MYKSFVAFCFGWFLLPQALGQNSVLSESAEVSVFEPYNFIVEPIKSVNVAPELSGQIEKIGFGFEERVSAGQVLFEINHSKLLPILNKSQQQVSYFSVELERVRQVFEKGDISRSHLHELENSLALAVAERDAIAKELEKAKIVAPFDGHVTAHNLQVGDVVSSGQHLTTLLADSAELYIDVFIPYDRAMLLRKGQHVLASYKAQQMMLEVSHVSPLVTKNNRLLTVRMLANSKTPLMPGLRSTIQLAINSKSGIKLSENAVLFDDQGSYVFVKNGGCINRKRVQFDYLGAGNVLVTDGLTEGETVINEGTLTAQWRMSAC